MAFDETKAYQGDWQYVGRVVDVTWEHQTLTDTENTTGLKARFCSVSTPDLVSVAAGLGLSTQAAAVVVWEPKPIDVAATDWQPSFNPKNGDTLRIEAGVNQSQGWVIHEVTSHSNQGIWHLLVDKELINA